MTSKTLSYCLNCSKINKVAISKVVFVKINTQAYPQASTQFNIRGIPTLLVYKFGK